MSIIKLHGRTALLIFIIIAQAFIFLVVAYYFYFRRDYNEAVLLGVFSWEQLTWILTVVGIGLFFLAIHMVQVIYYLTEKETEAELAVTRLKNSRLLVDALRAQRHDVLNHLQVIYGLIQLNKIENAQEYIRQVQKELSEDNALNQTDRYNGE